MVVLPLAGQSSGGSTTKPAGTASSTAKRKTAQQSVQKTKQPSKEGKKATRSASLTGKAANKPASPAVKAARRARTARIKLAFVASTELRPMAQQLATLRTPAAYAGVTKYAQQHSGEAAAAAYLALGHAYWLDKRYGEAIADFRLARQAGTELADYADFLAARANHEESNESAAEALLRGFTVRYAESIFVAHAPELEAETLLAMQDAAGAHRVLAAAVDTAAANRPGYQLAQGEVAFALGQAEEAERIYKRLLLGHPLSQEAEIARAKLTAMGAETSLSTAELRSLGDAYYNAGHYTDASEQYHTLARQSSLDA